MVVVNKIAYMNYKPKTTNVKVLSGVKLAFKSRNTNLFATVMQWYHVTRI